MAEKRTPVLGRKDSENSIPSKPSSPALDTRASTRTSNREDHDGILGSGSNCSSPLLPRRRGRFSFYSQNSDTSSKPKTKNFLRIFKWFRKRGKSKDSIENASNAASDSITSLNTSTQGQFFHPLARSKSADNQKSIAKSLTRTDTVRSVQTISSRSSPSRSTANSQTPVTYTNIEEMKSVVEASPSTGTKKRSAPQPPESQIYGDVIMRKNPNCSSDSDRYSSSDKNNPFWNNRYSRSDTSNPFYHDKRNSMDSTNSIEGRISRSSNDSCIYSRTKRKAPQPPVNNWTLKVQQLTHNLGKDETLASTTTNSDNLQRTACKQSAIDTNNPSISSTLQSISSHSNSTLRDSISSKCSGESLRLEKGYLKQDLVNSASSTTSSKREASSNSPNPKPWYKRKKNSKTNKKKEKLEPIDQNYEFWRPEIQFQDGKISLSKNEPVSSSPQTEKLSIRQKVAEACKPKRKSQISLLANISQLDQEAAEQLRKEKEETKAAKDAYDDKFYKKKGPLILTQTDVSGSSPEISPKFANNEDVTNLENWHCDKMSSENRLSYTKQSTLKLEKHGNCVNQNEVQSPTNHSAPDTSALKSDNLQSWPVNKLPSSNSVNVNNIESSTSTSAAPTPSSPSLLQMANLNAEMFYQLAKDIKNCPDSRVKQNGNELNRLTRRSSASSQESDSDHESSTPKMQRHPKNFGIRMNQLFTPDVSIILEASESTVSSANTPADEGSELIYQDVSTKSDLSADHRITKNNAREIMQELADVRQEINRINDEEISDAQLRKERNKGDKIREEVRLLRDRNNFSVWEEMIQGSSSNANPSTGIPPPIDMVTPKPETKWKWVCDVCTLINLPWKITCEACSSRRPNKPTRIREDGSRTSPPKTPSDHSVSSRNSNSEGSPLTVIQSNEIEEKFNDNDNQEFDRGRFSEIDSICPTDSASQIIEIRRTNWETELKKYFSGSGTNTQQTHILYNNVVGESEYGKINVSRINKPVTSTRGAIPKSTQEPGSSSNAPRGKDGPNANNIEPDLSELRRARVEKFEKGIRSFEAMISGVSENGGTTACNQDRRDPSDRPITNQISSMLPQFDSSEKVFYKKEARKRPLLKTRGAVKSTISIFNQKDQLDKAKVIKPSFGNQVRRKSNGLIKDQATMFEKMQTEKADLNRIKNSVKSFPQPKSIEKNPEIDISSAISKFDEIAAMAEVERLNPKLIRANLPRKTKKVIINTSKFSDNDRNAQVSSVSTPIKAEASYNNINNASSENNELATVQPLQHIDYQNQVNLQDAAELTALNDSKFELEPVILDGVLYTANEGRRRTTSMSSSTFELIHPTEFEEIEAEHSQKGSPTSEYEDAHQPGYDSDNTESFVDAVRERYSSYGFQSTTSVENINDLPLTTEEIMMIGNEDTLEDEFMSTTQDGPENNASSEADIAVEMERLSHQLTLSKGVANFKACLEAEGDQFTRSSTLDITRLLKKLEAAISKGDHAGAAQLAKELATLKVACSVTQQRARRNDTKKVQTVDETKANDDEVISGKPTKKKVPGGNSGNNSTNDQDNKFKPNVCDGLIKVGSEASMPAAVDNSGFTENPVINIQVTKEHLTSTTVHLAVQTGNETDKKVTSCGSEQTVQKREHKSVINRREVKSDNVSKLTESTTPTTSGMPSIIENFTVEMYVEDRASHQGPIDVSVNSAMTVGELRSKVYEEFGFPPEVQRWILGRRLADDDRQTLAQHRVTMEGCPIFLYLVAPRHNAAYNSQYTSSNNTTTNINRRNTEQMKSSTPKLKMALPKQLGCDSTGDEEGRKKLVSPILSMPRTFIKGVKEPNTQLMNRLNMQSASKVEDPIQGNELIRRQEELDMEGVRHLQGTAPPKHTVAGETVQISQYNRQSTNRQQKQDILSNNSSFQAENKRDVQISYNALKNSSTTERQLNSEVTHNQQQSSQHQTSILQQQYQQQQRQSVQQNGSSKQPPQQQAQLYRQKITQQQPTIQNVLPNITVKAISPISARKRTQDTVNLPQQLMPIQDTKLQDKHQENNQLQMQERLKQTQLQKQTMQYNQATNLSNSASSGPREDPKIIKNNTSTSIVGQAVTPKGVSASTTTSTIGMNTPKGFSVNSTVNQTTAFPASSTVKQTTTGVSSAGRALNERGERSTTPVDGWVCPRCTLVNHLQRPGCEACATERPEHLNTCAQAHERPDNTKKACGSLNREVTALESEGAVSSSERFECRVCYSDILPGSGVVLRDCLHHFCRECLGNSIRYSDTAEVKCPYMDDQYSCDSVLQDREIKSLVSAVDYEKHLQKSVKQAAGSMQNVFHCKTPDCRGFCIFEDNVNIYLCTVCYKQNCLTCQAQHAGHSCKDYQEMVAMQQDIDSIKTKKFFEDMIRRGDGMPCPQCSVMLVRKWGCDWMRCPMCRTEICWVTRGPRWGPKGQGDTTGGCQCGLKGRKCHPKCTYCH